MEQVLFGVIFRRPMLEIQIHHLPVQPVREGRRFVYNFSLCSHRGSCSAEAEGCRINGIFVVGPAKVSVVHRAQLFASEVMADWDNQFRMEHQNRQHLTYWYIIFSL